MPHPPARALPLIIAIAAAAIFFFAVLPGGGPTPGTAPAELAEPLDGATPVDVVYGFTDSLNAGDTEGVLDRLHPDVATVFLPGVAGLATPSPDEVRAAIVRYRALEATIAVERCDPSAAPLEVRTDLRILGAGQAGGTVLDCFMTFTSSFGRNIGQPSAHLFMRFDIGDNGIAAMYLSPVVDITP